MRTVTVRLPEELIECLDICSFKNGKSRSEIIRDALNHYMSRELENKKRKPRVRKVCLY